MIQLDDVNRLFESLVDAFASQWPGLADKPEENPTSAIRALWFASAGQHRSVQKAAVGDLPTLSGAQQNRLNRLIEQRLSGVPLAHLVGWQNFMGLELKAGPQALIPRKETEILGHSALQRLHDLVRTRGRARVMDVCTGSGNLALALAVREPACQVVASDLCAEAVALARENALIHRLQDRVEFRIGDLFVPFAQGDFDGTMDLVVCNPPYLSSSKARALPREIGEFEPREAFDAGSFGLAIISRLISDAPRFLKPDSWLCFEVGLGQGPFFAARLEKSGAYQTVEPVKDAAGEVRTLVAQTHG
jgi:release factor glutamine methyltransferase